MKKLITIISLCALLTESHAQRSRHVAEEWNTKSVNLSPTAIGSGSAWHYLDWFGAYYQTYDWWIYHCEKGWLYPESDGSCGVWLWDPSRDSWIWTRGNIYPYAWDNKLLQWFNFCDKTLSVDITE